MSERAKAVAECKVCPFRRMVRWSKAHPSKNLWSCSEEPSIRTKEGMVPLLCPLRAGGITVHLAEPKGETGGEQ